MDKWVNVKDNLPDENPTVLYNDVFWVTDGDSVWPAYFIGGSTKWSNLAWEDFDNDITHWQKANKPKLPQG